MKLLRIFKAEPVATMAIVTAFFGVLTLLGVPKEFTGSVGVLLGAILAFPVRGTVNTVAKTVQVVTEATTKAALQPVETVDVPGIVSDTLKAAGFSRKDRQK